MKSLLLLLVTCFSCLAQFGVEQPMFQLSSSGPTLQTAQLLFAWEADVGVTNTSDNPAANGDRIKIWGTNGAGIYNYTLFQLGSATHQPIYNSSGGPNNKQYVEFPLANDHNYTRLTNKFTQNFQFPLLVVSALRLTRTDANRGYIMDGNTARTSLIQLETETKFSLAAPSGGIVSEAVLLNTWYLVTAYYKTNQNYFRTNGVACSSVGGNNIGTDGLTGISIGGSYFDGYQFDGDIAGFWVYGSTTNTISSNDVRTIEMSIGPKYGFTIP